MEKFSLREVLIESAEKQAAQKVQKTDGQITGGEKIDMSFADPLIGNNLAELYNHSDSLTGEVCKGIREAYADPDRVILLKLSEDTYAITSDDISRYMKATNKTLEESVTAIGESNNIYLETNNTYIIFPSKSELNESCECLGYHNAGWSSNLLQTCVNTGFKVKTMAEDLLDDEGK